MAKKRPSVLIGIPSFRRPEGLRKLLNSLAAQEGLEQHSIAVFVADNDAEGREAQDVAKELAPTFPWPLMSRIVEERGLSAVRNALLAEARDTGADFIAMIDDDEVAEPQWLSQLLDCQRRFDADVVGGPVHFDFDQEPSISVRRSGIFDIPQWKEGLVPLLYASGNLLVSTRALETAGWPRFDPAFGLSGGEDGELLRRMAKAGARFAWSPTAVARETVPGARSCPKWVLGRSLRKGNINMRVDRLHGGARGVAISLGKATAWLGSAPASALLLAVPSRRLWIMGKWYQSVGKVQATFGRSHEAYGAPNPSRDRVQGRD